MQKLSATMSPLTDSVLKIAKYAKKEKRIQGVLKRSSYLISSSAAESSTMKSHYYSPIGDAIVDSSLNPYFPVVKHNILTGFQSEYPRNNKDSKSKIIRCFPDCCVNGHRDRR